jgi:hypothetical protein
MTRSRFAVIFIAVFVLLTSCQKEVTGDIEPISSDTYQPVTAGSFWVYKDSATGAISTSTSLSTTKIIDNKTYYVFKSETTGQPIQESYIRINNHLYAAFGNLNNFGSIELIYLYDNQPKGFTWSYLAGIVNGFPAKINGKIIATGINKNVAGKTYNNVIHTQFNLEYDLGMGYQRFAVYDYFVAKNIGIIRVETDINASATVYKSVSNLLDYSIK